MSNFNIETKVTDAGIWWENIRQAQGLKLQQNILSGHYRIINPSKIRKAWGSDLEEMVEMFESFTMVHKPRREETAPSQQAPKQEKPSKSEILAQLKELGELRENGVLTEAEFEAMKKKLLKEL